MPPKAKAPVTWVQQPSQKPCVKLSCNIPKAWARDIHPLSLPWPQKAPPEDTAGLIKKGFRGTSWNSPPTTTTHYQQAALEGSALPRQQPVPPLGLGRRAEGHRVGPPQMSKGHPLAQVPRCGHCGEHCSSPPRSLPAENSAGAAF